MWRRIDAKPTEPGIYVVARFEGDVMVDLDTNWAFCEGYFGPNNVTWQENIHPTHWMTKNDYRRLMEAAPREV